MARKDLLSRLMNQGEGAPSGADESGDGAAPPAPQPRRKRGAIGAVSKSIAELKSNAVVSLDPHLIAAGGVQDRLEHDEADHARLMDSLSRHGQQVPILVRPHPEEAGRYQIVYGRRRVLAARDLGIEIKALIRDLDDGGVILAQGQENTARRDLSFIEKVNFARQMAEAGYPRAAICDALSVDKTVISRMLKIAAAVPTPLIEGIGAAPAAGRDRWSTVADRLADRDEDPETLLSVVCASAPPGSDARFDALFSYLTDRPAPRADRPAPERLQGANGEPLGAVRRAGKTTRLTLQAGGAFETWLIDNLPDLHRQWLSSHEATGVTGQADTKPDKTGPNRAATKGGRPGKTS